MVFDTFCILLYVDTLSPCPVSRCSYGFGIFPRLFCISGFWRLRPFAFLSIKAEPKVILKNLQDVQGWNCVKQAECSLGAAIPLALKN